MSQTGQIKFFRKSFLDLDMPNPTLSVVDTVATNDGADSIGFLRNRSNDSGWATTGSDDTANTQLEAFLGDIVQVDFIMFTLHNFKDYLVEYFDIPLDSYQPLYNIVGDDKTTTTFTPGVETNRIRLTIYGTQVADADKVMRQFIVTQNFGSGSFEGWPTIKNPTTSFNKKKNKLLGGRVNIIEKRGSFSADLTVKFLVKDNDLSIIEDIYYNREGVLMMLSGNKEDQFRTQRVGYRNQDIVLIRPTNELILPYDTGIYTNGIKIKMKLEEVIF